MKTFSFKVKNPYRADEIVKQEVVIGTDLQYNYDQSTWVAMDTEYLSFNPQLDKLCVIQLASKEHPDAQVLRVEIIYVYDNPPTPKLNQLVADPKIEKLFHVYSSDMPRIEKFCNTRIKGKIFDTKVAAKIAWTNTQDHGMKNLIKMFADPNFDQKNNEKGLNDWEIGPENWSNEQVFYMMQDVIYLDVLRTRILDMAQRRGRKEIVEETMTILPTISNLFAAGFDQNVLAY